MLEDYHIQQIHHTNQEEDKLDRISETQQNVDQLQNLSIDMKTDTN